jgi:hypothetical protein
VARPPSAQLLIRLRSVSLNHASRVTEDHFNVKAFHLATVQGRGCVAVMDVGVSGVDAADGLGNREEVGPDLRMGPDESGGAEWYD